MATTRKSALAHTNAKYGRGLAVASYSRISDRYASFYLKVIHPRFVTRRTYLTPS
ncbi:MAG: hypothetical protein ACRD1I_00890 [Terriglobia bacterium]